MRGVGQVCHGLCKSVVGGQARRTVVQVAMVGVVALSNCIELPSCWPYIVKKAQKSRTWQWASGHIRSLSEECM